MPRQSPYSIVLSPEEKTYLERLSRKYTAPYNVVVRAKAILLAAEGLDNKTMGQTVDLLRQIVSKWRMRFKGERMGGLEDRDRPGRPPVFPPEVVVQVKALACELPYEAGIPLSRFSCREITAETVRRGSLPASAARRCGAGWMRMRLSRGSIVVGSIRGTRI